MDVLHRQLDTLVDELKQAENEVADQVTFSSDDYVVRLFVNNA